MRGLLLAAAFASACSAAEPAEPTSVETRQLAACRAETLNEAAQCLVNTVPADQLARFRTDRYFEPKVYAAITNAWHLNDAKSPLSRSLQAERIYNPIFSPGIIILAAQSRLAGRDLDLDPIRTAVARINAAERQQRAEWQPPVPEGMSRVALMECPDVPVRQHPRAACFKSADGRTMIITPNSSAEGDARGN
jgi:hypothetical protein